MKIALGLALGMIALSSQGNPDYIMNGKTMEPNIPVPPNGGGYPVPPIGNFPIPPSAGPGYPVPPIGNFPIPPSAGPGYPVPPIGNIPVGPINPPNGGFFPGCKVSGYYRHLCMVQTDPNIYDPNTPYDPAYRCLRNAVCKFKGGVCRWVRTQKYKSCMDNLIHGIDPHNNGMF